MTVLAAITQAHPSRASASAHSRPIPREPPVMIATRPRRWDAGRFMYGTLDMWLDRERACCFFLSFFDPLSSSLPSTRRDGEAGGGAGGPPGSPPGPPPVTRQRGTAVSAASRLVGPGTGAPGSTGAAVFPVRGAGGVLSKFYCYRVYPPPCVLR